MDFLSNPRSSGCGGLTLSRSKSNLISSASLLTAKKIKETTLEYAEVIIVSVTYLMYIPRVTMVGEDAVDTTSMM